MATISCPDHGCLPSVQQRITALYNNYHLFETVADFPQAGIYQTYEKESALITAYIESEVRQRWHDLDVFLRRHAQPGGEVRDAPKLGREYRNVMKKFIDIRLLHARVVDISCTDAHAPAPTKLFMDKYRVNCNLGEGSERAANGMMLREYGEKGDSVPLHCATICDDDLEPMAKFLADWLMDPFTEYVVEPIRSLVRLESPFTKADTKDDDKIEHVGIPVINGIAKAFVSTLAILSLAIPIGALSVLEKPVLRFVVMTLFGHAFAMSVQFMGARSIPTYMLITAYFQVMVIFFGSTSK